MGLTDIEEHLLLNKSCFFWEVDSKNVNKIKNRTIYDQVMTLLRKYVFLFSRFYWFLESSNFVISEVILNLKTVKSLVQALSKTFLINFFVKWSLHAQNAVQMQVPHPIFVAALCSNRDYLGGDVRKQLSQQFTFPYKECSVRSFSNWRTAVRRGILDRRHRSKKPNLV